MLQIFKLIKIETSLNVTFDQIYLCEWWDTMNRNTTIKITINITCISWWQTLILTDPKVHLNSQIGAHTQQNVQELFDQCNNNKNIKVWSVLQIEIRPNETKRLLCSKDSREIGYGYDVGWFISIAILRRFIEQITHK